MTATNPPNDLDWLLRRIVERLPDARAAVLASADGVRTHRHGISGDEADRLSAIAVGLYSLGRGIGRFGGHSTDVVRQVIVEHADALLFVAGAAPGTVVAVLTTPNADPGLVGHEMAQAVSAVTKHLATAPRSLANGSGSAGDTSGTSPASSLAGSGGGGGGQEPPRR
jgi:predicted regulator of Ras-like GTPase activity (Roadblock/LC7/MglB family)